MRQYELTYLISDAVSESEINKVSGKVNGYVNDAKGKILKEESWGRRKLAYPIKKQQFATYITLNFELEPENLREIEKDIIHAPEILRHLTIVRDFGKEELTLTAEDIAETEEIEEVVGGEKSFEAVEGETEESYDLMAKRDESDEDSDEKLEMRDETATGNKKSEMRNKEKAEDIKEKAEMPEVKEKADKKTPKVRVKKEKAEKAEEVIEKKPAKKVKAEKSTTVKATEDKKAEKKTTAKPKAKTKAIKDDNVEDEADRLAKLDKELDDILGDDL